MMDKPRKMPNGRGMLGIVISPHHEEPDGDEPTMDSHEDKMAAAEEISKLLGADLDEDKLHRFVEALSAFHEAHQMSKDDMPEDEEDEDY